MSLSIQANPADVTLTTDNLPCTSLRDPTSKMSGWYLNTAHNCSRLNGVTLAVLFVHANTSIIKPQHGSSIFLTNLFLCSYTALLQWFWLQHSGEHSGELAGLFLAFLQSLFLLGRALRLTAVRENPDSSKQWETEELVCQKNPGYWNVNSYKLVFACGVQSK